MSQGKAPHMDLKETADAMSAFHMALLDIDDRRAAFRHMDLVSSDITWRERVESVLNGLDMAWLAREPDEPPPPDRVAIVGAHLLAMYVAAARAEQLRVDTGDEDDG